MLKKKGFSKAVTLVIIIFVLVSGIYLYYKLVPKGSPDESKVKMELNKARVSVSTCLLKGGKVNSAVAGTNICTKSLTAKNRVWPTLPSGWKYSSDGNLTSKDSVSLIAVSGNSKITCDKKGCK